MDEVPDLGGGTPGPSRPVARRGHAVFPAGVAYFMIMPSLLKPIRRAVLCLCLALSFVTFALPTRADDPPKFSAPEVNDFVKKFGDLVDAYVKAVKAKDEGKKAELDAKGKELDGLSNTVESRIKPEEMEAFGKYMTAQSQKLMDAEQEAAK